MTVAAERLVAGRPLSAGDIVSVREVLVEQAAHLGLALDPKTMGVEPGYAFAHTSELASSRLFPAGSLTQERLRDMIGTFVTGVERLDVFAHLGKLSEPVEVDVAELRIGEDAYSGNYYATLKLIDDRLAAGRRAFHTALGIASRNDASGRMKVGDLLATDRCTVDSEKVVIKGDRLRRISRVTLGPLGILPTVA